MRDDLFDIYEVVMPLRERWPLVLESNLHTGGTPTRYMGFGNSRGFGWFVEEE